jgi:hypothetical protein
VRQVFIRVAEAMRAIDPHLFAAQLLTRCRQHTPFVRNAIDRPAVLFIADQFLPVVVHHPFHRHLFACGKHRSLAVAVLLEQGQGVHHGTVDIVVASEGEHLHQSRHDAAVVMAVGSARYPLHPVLVVVSCLGLANYILQGFLADPRFGFHL